MATRKQDTVVDPVDVQIGGDADFDGIAQTITSDDIQAILISSEPIETRREQLQAVKAELQARKSADRGGEFDPLLDEVEGAIETLGQTAGETATRTGLAMDRENRSDLRSPEADVSRD
ncbi:hypothetical protein [Oricola cellulosilytica]|uniref:Uncharacterized protein n=1 Tax=Oricola cellulosilytica TaxID=1429082 RepID=A0A4R0PEU0_9HYPH|nr:hypothetical protein [Oricola cellulosilytica]TCD15079.1 hypothetical protein E0D97_05900 [Oricola cellulosilytica]